MMRVTNLEVREMIAMYANGKGKTLRQIAEYIGCSMSTVKYHVNPKYRQYMQDRTRTNHRKKHNVPESKYRSLRP